MPQQLLLLLLQLLMLLLLADVFAHEGTTKGSMKAETLYVQTGIASQEHVAKLDKGNYRNYK